MARTPRISFLKIILLFLFLFLIFLISDRAVMDLLLAQRRTSALTPLPSISALSTPATTKSHSPVLSPSATSVSTLESSPLGSKQESPSSLKNLGDNSRFQAFIQNVSHFLSTKNLPEDLFNQCIQSLTALASLEGNYEARVLAALEELRIILGEEEIDEIRSLASITSERNKLVEIGMANAGTQKKQLLFYRSTLGLTHAQQDKVSSAQRQSQTILLEFIQNNSAQETTKDRAALYMRAGEKASTFFEERMREILTPEQFKRFLELGELGTQ